MTTSKPTSEMSACGCMTHHMAAALSAAHLSRRKRPRGLCSRSYSGRRLLRPHRRIVGSGGGFQFHDACAGGAGGNSEVVLYRRDNIQWATRVWWMMRAIGFDSASVLDGGFDGWLSEGRAPTTKIMRYPATNLTPRPRAGLFCDSATVLAAMEEPNTCVINALRTSLHDGSEAVNYGRPGRIPGSVSVPGISLLDPNTKAYRPLSDLERIFAESGALDAEKVVIYCGGGIAATSDAFTLTRLGKDAVTIYDASMSEWANDPSLPMETG